jgi:hypothetical protein
LCRTFPSDGGKMNETTTLSADEITVTPVAQQGDTDYTCCNSDPYDSCYSYYDSDPTNGRW